MSARCSSIRNRLPLFAGGDLDPRVAARVRTHLMACAECRRELSPLVRARAALTAAQGDDPVVRANTRFFADLHRDVMALVRTQPRRRAARLHRLWGRASAVAAAAALFVVGLFTAQWLNAPDGLRQRDPIAPAAVPSGPQGDPGVDLRPLATDPTPWPEVDPATAGSQGLRGRLSLRRLDWLLVPPPAPETPAPEKPVPEKPAPEKR